MKNLFLFLLLIASLSSCGDNSAEEEEMILDYLNTNNLTADKTEEGIYYIINDPGNGEMPSINHTVTVKYTGYLLDGTVFDETQDNETRNFQLWGGLIEGWKISMPLLGKGGNGTFFIPSRYGYGSNGNGSIPGNSVLVFDINLVDFQ